MQEALHNFRMNGYVTLKNVISRHLVTQARRSCLRLKTHIMQNDLIGKKRDFGAGEYLPAIDVAGTLDPNLFRMYTSPFMYRIAGLFLGQEEIYLFNDQVVVKLPHEPFEFSIHTDNDLGPDPKAARRGEFRTITCAWILDTMTPDNGPITIWNKTLAEFQTVLPESGDMVIWDGNTPHGSPVNDSDEPRCVWLLVYATKSIGHFFLGKEERLPNFKGFYTEQFRVVS